MADVPIPDPLALALRELRDSPNTAAAGERDAEDADVLRRCLGRVGYRIVSIAEDDYATRALNDALDAASAREERLLEALKAVLPVAEETVSILVDSEAEPDHLPWTFGDPLPPSLTPEARGIAAPRLATVRAARAALTGAPADAR